jgi:hypothetical protein
VEDRRFEQEGAHVLGLTVEHLLDEVVEDEAVAAGERVDELTERAAFVAPSGEGGELQAAQPSLRLSSAATCAGSRLRLITSLRKTSASSGVNRRSAARISSSSPRVRSRDGDLRRQVVEHEGHRLVHRGVVDGVVIGS